MAWTSRTKSASSARATGEHSKPSVVPIATQLVVSARIRIVFSVLWEMAV
jgi:hypothetical protein